MKWSKIKDSVMFPLCMFACMFSGAMIAIWLMWNTISHGVCQ